MGGATLIETITVTRPMKVIAFVLCTLSVFMTIAACSTSDWVMSEGWREGLWRQCVDQGSPTPLPFGGDEIPGCSRSHPAGYVRGTAALVIICCFTDFFGTLLTGLGLRSTDPNKKYKYYRVAIYALVVALLTLVLALIIYPVSFSKDMAQAKRLDGGIVDRPIAGSFDFDNDGILDHLDDDDDNDGIADVDDDDDDNDGILDTLDDDDDNDGIPDIKEQGDDDFDNDGVPDAIDNDDDNDGIPDNIDNDSDNDGIPNSQDNDDDNDGIPDELEADSDEDEDEDEDNDADNDGVPDDEDMDDDNDGIIDALDDDDDGDGIPDSEDIEGNRRVWQFGFGYGCSCASAIFLFVSLVLLICDHESEEIFYKERATDEEEAGEEEE